MRENRLIQVIGALLLIAVGVLFLLENLGFVPQVGAYVWSLLFLAGGIVFLLAYLFNRSQWWPLIPGSALVGLGLLILLTGTNLVRGEVGAAILFLSLAAGFGGVYLARPRENWWAIIPGGAMVFLALMVLVATGSGEWAGSILFLGLGLVFVALYFAEIGGRRYNWWTLIPAGALLSLAAVIILSSFGLGGAAGAALFIGLGLTFGVLYLMRGPGRDLGWAWIPALALLLFGAFIFLVSGDFPFARFVWPLALIAAGLVVLILGWRRRD